MFVVTMDQKGSRQGPDRVPELLAALSSVATVLPFERTVGDEVQGLLTDPEAVARTLNIALRHGGWHIGVGIGPADTPLPQHVREASGEAFWKARDAVERSKTKRRSAPVAVEGGIHPERAEAVLALLSRLMGERSERDWQYIDQLRAHGGRQKDVASALGVSPQAVSQAVSRAGYEDEEDAQETVRWLLGISDNPRLAESLTGHEEGSAA